LTDRRKALDHFRRYLEHGVYPFYREGVELYPIRLANVVEKVVSDDIPSVMSVRPGSVPILRKMLHLVASSEPLTPNVERMASALGASKPTVYQFLEYLERAGLLALVPPAGSGLKAVRRPARIYLDNPNLFGALVGSEERSSRIGTVRETFFAHQVRGAGALRVDPRVDFLLESGERVEVGGRSKGWAQLENDPNAWLAVDDVEVGAGHRVPLWLFGFLY
jgi:predicted AAA+ superfamily ATPase